jgi:hypothetical protein
MKTVQDLRAASVLKLCYPDDQIQAFIDHRDAVGWTEALLELHRPNDACWALAGWLSPERRVEWAQASARRAQEYAARAARAARAAAYAAHAASAADAYAAADAAADAYAAAAHAADAAAHAAADAAAPAASASAAAAAHARADEYRTAIRHGAMLLEQQLAEGVR